MSVLHDHPLLFAVVSFLIFGYIIIPWFREMMKHHRERPIIDKVYSLNEVVGKGEITIEEYSNQRDLLLDLLSVSTKITVLVHLMQVDEEESETLEKKGEQLDEEMEANDIKMENNFKELKEAYEIDRGSVIKQFVREYKVTREEAEATLDQYFTFVTKFE